MAEGLTTGDKELTARKTRSKPEANRIRFHVYLLGIALMPVAGRWIFKGEMEQYTFATWAAPFYNAVYLLFLLTLLNFPLRRIAPGMAFNKLELMAVYVMVSVGSAIMSSDFQGILITIMGYPARYADQYNNWGSLFDGVLPKWLLVNDRDALKGFYFGNTTFWMPEHYRVWIKPAACWTVFIYALMALMIATCAILRKAWVERERLTFPIVALPIAMTEEPDTFFRNKLMWIGFAIAGGITLLNGLQFLFPSLPHLQIRRIEYRFAGNGPLDALSPIRVSFYFFAIALGFLMPLDLGISLSAFYWLYRFEGVAAAMVGIPPGSKFPYYDSQAFGAYMGIFVMTLWGLKGHLKTVWKTALIGRGTDEDANEPMSYRSALMIFGLSALFLIWFAAAAGMHPFIAIIFFAVYLALCVVISRIRAEFGFPVHDMHFMGPGTVMIRSFGAQAFDHPTLGAFSLFYWFSRVFRSHPMPHQLEAMKVAGQDRSSQRAMMWAMVIACAVAVPVCFGIYLHCFYKLGAATARNSGWGWGYGVEVYTNYLTKWLSSPDLPRAGENIATGLGFAFSLGLAAMRRHIVGFPLHPLAYAVANSWGMQNLWLPILIGTILKSVTLKGSGLKGYRTAVMFFFGLMLGEFAVGCTWTILGMLLGIRTYDFWP